MPTVETSDHRNMPSEAEMLAEAYASVAPRRTAEPTPREQLELKLSGLTDELAVAAYEGETKTLTKLEAERTSVQLELDRLVSAERGQAISEQRAATAKRQRDRAEALERQRQAGGELIPILDEADKHLRAWCQTLQAQFDVGLAAGDVRVHETIVRRLRMAMFAGLESDVARRRIFSAFGDYPSARDRG